MDTTDEQVIDLSVAGRAVRFAGDPRDPYFRSLASFHAAAPRLEYYLRRHVRPDAVCLDIGANIGLTAVVLSLYSPAGRVYCFEASPRNARYLRRNLELNGIGNCVVVESAVGDGCGRVPFRETDFRAGSHVAHGPADAPGEPSVISVPLTTVDAFVEAHGLAREKIDFMKLDVEGFEPAVLAGAAGTIEASRCPIFMEFNSWCLLMLHNFSPVAFAAALLGSFSVERVEESGALVPHGDGTVGGFLYGNILRNGCVDDILIRLAEGKRVPPLDEMTKYGGDLANARELQRLRKERDAMRGRP
jgi:FkbM family methyltransferase